LVIPYLERLTKPVLFLEQGRHSNNKPFFAVSLVEKEMAETPTFK